MTDEKTLREQLADRFQRIERARRAAKEKMPDDAREEIESIVEASCAPTPREHLAMTLDKLDNLLDKPQDTRTIAIDTLLSLTQVIDALDVFFAAHEHRLALTPGHYLQVDSVDSEGHWTRSPPIFVGEQPCSAEQAEHFTDRFVERFPDRQWSAHTFEVKP